MLTLLSNDKPGAGALPRDKYGAGVPIVFSRDKYGAGVPIMLSRDR
jgi:hypothetical protein